MRSLDPISTVNDPIVRITYFAATQEARLREKLMIHELERLQHLIGTRQVFAIPSRNNLTKTISDIDTSGSGFPSLPLAPNNLCTLPSSSASGKNGMSLLPSICGVYETRQLRLHPVRRNSQNF